MTVRLLLGMMEDRLAELPDASVDACVTDPPYELGFMGKGWDRSGVAFAQATWAAVWRVLKPGGHLVAFGGTRTVHRIAVAIEDAGFEIRDQVYWLYGEGFPKSHNISKAIDQAAGVERPKLATRTRGQTRPPAPDQSGGRAYRYGETFADEASVTEDAQRWDGWGTALKPACEPIVLARKPFPGNVAANVVTHGTGALHVAACRVGEDGGHRMAGHRAGANPDSVHCYGDGLHANISEPVDGLGRWPANVVVDDAAAAMIDEQSGEGGNNWRANKGLRHSGRHGGFADLGPNPKFGTDGPGGHNDTGGASRFYYCAKADRAERELGLYGMEPQPREAIRQHGQAGTDNGYNRGAVVVLNHHPTVKPIALMQWLVRLVTPPGGIVLDPFAGSGTTGIATEREGFDAILIERDAGYIELARRRVLGDAPMFNRVEMDP